MTAPLRRRRRPGEGSPASRRKLLRKLLTLQERRCFYCRALMVRVGEPGVNPKHWLVATLDEKLPFWLGGEQDEENCVAACNNCNNRKGPLDAETFIALRHDFAALERALRGARELAAAVSRGDTIPWQRLEHTMRRAGLDRAWHRVRSNHV